MLKDNTAPTFDLSLRRDRLTPLKLEFDGDTLELKYRKALFTLAFEEELQAAIRTGDAEAILAKLCEVIAEWNVTEGKEPVPISPEALRRQLGSQELGAIIQAIEENQRPNARPEASSPAG